MTRSHNAQVAAHRDLGEPNTDDDGTEEFSTRGHNAVEALLNDDEEVTDNRTALERAFDEARTKFPSVASEQALRIVRAVKVVDVLSEFRYQRAKAVWAIVQKDDGVLAALELLAQRMMDDEELKQFSDYLAHNAR